MAKSNNQKAKILFLEQMLRETGENHVVSMQEILETLAEHGIAAERKSIYDDMDALRAFGMDVRFQRGRPGGYYLAGQQAVKPDKKVSQVETKPSKTEPETVISRIPVFKDMVRPGEKKQMLLYGEKSAESEIRDFFGDTARISSEDPELLIVEAPLSLDPRFFGWVTAMNGAVHLRKPKKLAQTFRDYLKALAKEYKGIGKKEE